MPIDELLEPERLWSREEVIATRPSPVPKTGGVYAWYFRQIPGAIDTSRCHMHDGMTLLYVGIAPKNPMQMVGAARPPFISAWDTTTPATPRVRRYGSPLVACSLRGWESS